MKQKIAIVGSGISGLTCAYLLHKEHDITLFEANDYIGGHTATVDFSLDGREYAIDTGFIVFNDWTYPNFIRLLDQLSVRSQATQMSFSVKNQAKNLEYNGHTLNTLFAQRRNLIRPTFWRMVSDIVRFNRLCKNLLARNKQDPAQSLHDFIQQHGFSRVFSDNYLLPMCAAIWSASLQETQQLPMGFFLQFFNNHGLLNISDRPQWRTIVGGSKSYVEPLTAGFNKQIRLNSPIKSIALHNGQYTLQIADQPTQHFDQVILACHSDQALAMLAKPNSSQQQILSAIPYAENDVVLHTDTRLLPNRELAWASWNYWLKGDVNEQQDPATVTYNMNILQRLDAPHTFCVTLNNTAAIDPNKIIRRFRYAHPQFSQQTLLAQQRRMEICGQQGLHFCGAYWYNGFHEDGVKSALDVCQRFGASLC